jgi:hypothetical protein
MFLGTKKFQRKFRPPRCDSRGGFFCPRQRTAFVEIKIRDHCKRMGHQRQNGSLRRSESWNSQASAGVLSKDMSIPSALSRVRRPTRGLLAGLFVYHCSFSRRLERALAVSTFSPGRLRPSGYRAGALAGRFTSNTAQERLPALCGLSGLRCGGLTPLPFLRF